jgi:flagellar basal-body rod protein FlgB
LFPQIFFLDAEFSTGPKVAIFALQAMLDSTAIQLDRYLTLVSERQRLVASNIANADTPGYKTQDIDFEAQLHAALQAPDDATPAPPMASAVPGLRVKNDGNNIDLDREARLLSENALRFNMATNFLRSDLKDLHMAIQGGSA